MDVIEDVFNKYLVRNNMKMTIQRRLILHEFLKSDKHVSSEELYKVVSKKDKSIGQATVYRLLKLLSLSGIAREEDFGDGVKRYEMSYGNDHHDHLICVRCNDKIEVINHEIELLQEKLAEDHGFKLTSHKMDLYGLCKECRKHQEEDRMDVPQGKVLDVDALPLALLNSGVMAEVLDVNLSENDCCGVVHGNDSRGQLRIKEMGIRAGKTVEMLNNGKKGPVLFKIDESRIALGRSLAMKILVKIKAH